VELLREIVPAMKHVGVLVNPANPGSAVQMPGVEDAARAMGLQLKIVEPAPPKNSALDEAHDRHRRLLRPRRKRPRSAAPPSVAKNFRRPMWLANQCRAVARSRPSARRRPVRCRIRP
jgi:hypothetical protein